jgi:hypothetical protein
MPHTSPPSPAHVLPTFSKVLVGPGTGRARYRGALIFGSRRISENPQ